jgi:hypothetical protein
VSEVYSEPQITQSGLARVSNTDYEVIRQWCLDDPYFFLVNVCRFKDLVPRFHRPLAYLMAGEPHLLLWSLKNYDSMVTAQLKDEMRRFGIDLSNPDIADVRQFCRFLNIRIARGFYKTSLGVGTNTWRITKDPNHTTLIIHGIDDGAWAMCGQMGDIIKGDIYGALFPDRTPNEPKKDITRERIQLRGRTVPHRDPCVTAKGSGSDITGGHFSTFYFDDLVTEKMTITEILKAREYTNRVNGLRIKSEPLTRIHIGTVYDDEDDNKILRGIEHCVQIHIPLEVHYDDHGKPEPTTVYNVMKPGVLTLPELPSHTREEVDRLKKEYLADPEKGVYSLLKNQYLVGSSTGDERFPPSVVFNRKYELVTVGDDPKTAKTFIRRQDRDINGQLLWLDPEKTKPKLRLVDPSTLRIAIGEDPAVSQSATADIYGCTALGMDEQGIVYQLKTVAGKGWEQGLEQLRFFDEEFDFPPKVGIENGAIKILLVALMQRDSRWRRLTSRIVGVAHNNVSKEKRIDTLVSAPLKMGTLLLHPQDVATRQEMIAYRPGKNAKDGRLDSIAIAMTVLSGSVLGNQAESNKHLEALDREYEASLEGGLPTYSFLGDDIPL